jgi:glucose/arabinose dehydrogenase
MLALLHANVQSATILQPDLSITRIGSLVDEPPSQMAFGPDGRLYVTAAIQNVPDAVSVVSFAYDRGGNLSDRKIVARTGGALGIAFGPVSLGNAGTPGVVTTTGMYLTDAVRNNVSNLRVLTTGANGDWGAAGGLNTVIVQNLPAGFHQADQLITQKKSDGSVVLYAGIGVRTIDGVNGYPRTFNAKDNAYGGTISWIKDLRQVNGTVTDSAGFGLTGNISNNNQPDYSNAGPYTSTALNKLVVHSSGARNPYGLALDKAGNLWFTNNFQRAQSDGTFDGTLNPNTHALKGYNNANVNGVNPSDPEPGPDLKNNVHDQLYKAVEKGDYGYNNINWRDDPAHSNTALKSRAGVDAGFFDPKNLQRSKTFDNLSEPPGGFKEYDQSDINHIVGLGPSSSADGFAFYTGTAFPESYRGNAFIARWTPSISDSTGHTIQYADVVAVDPVTGNVRRIANRFSDPIDVEEDGFGNLLVADYGDRSIWRISAAVPEPSMLVLMVGGVLLVLAKRARACFHFGADRQSANGPSQGALMVG